MTNRPALLGHDRRDAPGHEGERVSAKEDADEDRREARIPERGLDDGTHALVDRDPGRDGRSQRSAARAARIRLARARTAPCHGVSGTRLQTSGGPRIWPPEATAVTTASVMVRFPALDVRLTTASATPNPAPATPTPTRTSHARCWTGSVAPYDGTSPAAQQSARSTTALRSPIFSAGAPEIGWPKPEAR